MTPWPSSVRVTERPLQYHFEATYRPASSLADRSPCRRSLISQATTSTSREVAEVGHVEDTESCPRIVSGDGGLSCGSQLSSGWPCSSDRPRRHWRASGWLRRPCLGRGHGARCVGLLGGPGIRH